MANTDLEPQGGIFTATVLPLPAGHRFLSCCQKPWNTRQLPGSWRGSLLPISNKNFKVFWRCSVEIKKPPTSPALITFKFSSTTRRTFHWHWCASPSSPLPKWPLYKPNTPSQRAVSVTFTDPHTRSNDLADISGKQFSQPCMGHRRSCSDLQGLLTGLCSFHPRSSCCETSFLPRSS